MHKHLTGRDGTRVSSRRKLLQKKSKNLLAYNMQNFPRITHFARKWILRKMSNDAQFRKKKSVQTTKYDTIYRLSKFNYVWEIAKIHLIKLITIQGYTSFGLIIELRTLEIKGILLYHGFPRQNILVFLP